MVRVEVECRWFGQIARWEIEKWPQDSNLASDGGGEGQASIAFKQTDSDSDSNLQKEMKTPKSHLEDD